MVVIERLILLMLFETVSGSVGDWLLSRLLVSVEVEVDEQEEVACQNGTAEQGGVRGARAVGDVGEVRVVVGSKVLIGAKVNEVEVNDKLYNLHGGEVLLPPESTTTSGGVIIVVHDDMDPKVDGNDCPGNGSLAVQLSIAQQGGSRMMENVKELERLLLESEEHGVNEFEILEVVVANVVEFHSWGP